MEPNERGRINVHYIIAYLSIDTTGFAGFQWGLAGTGVRLSLNGKLLGDLITDTLSDKENL